MFKTQNFFLFAYMLLMSINGYGQERFVPFKYGDFNSWVTRHVKESGIIGGDTKTLYEVGPTQSISGNEPYTNKGGSPWGTSNVMAKVSGITKTNVSVFREKRDAGYCAKLVTHIEKVKVLGLININVLAAGSLYLGDMKEPITGTKEGPQALNWGIQFTGRPKALRLQGCRSQLAGPHTPHRLQRQVHHQGEGPCSDGTAVAEEARRCKGQHNG